MRKCLKMICIVLMLVLGVDQIAWANEPDSVYLFSYATIKDNGRSGLHFAWSIDKKTWNVTDNEAGFLRCDFGTQKFINAPYVFQDQSGAWQCIWSLNESVNRFAHAASNNLVTWDRQSYPYISSGNNFRQPVVHYNKSNGKYEIAFLSGSQYFQISTRDFKGYDSAVIIPVSRYEDDRVAIDLPAGRLYGNLNKVAWRVLATLNESLLLRQNKRRQSGESFKTDSLMFAKLTTVTATITMNKEKARPISDLLIGVFFEDINYSADGGLYAELLQNRDFEYQPVEKLYSDTTWNNLHSWATQGQLKISIDSTAPLHPNNPRYAVLDAAEKGGSLTNTGFDGISLKQGARYNFSLFAKSVRNTNLVISLIAKNGKILARSGISIHSSKWKKYATTLTIAENSNDAVLKIQTQSPGQFMLDMISLFPEKTFKDRKNGMRQDLAETIADLHPKFLRFPGGCVAHGDGVDNIYHWKNTIGPIETRKPQPNIWRYHQSVGLGYYEYFQYCEDIGAEPVPIIAAGVPCQNSGLLDGLQGQQKGILMTEMKAYIQDIADLIEWANGPADSKWGKLRANAGHPAPFHLKYIGIGNEDLISDVFEEHFTAIYKSLQTEHPEIKIIGTVGPLSQGTDYEQGWALADKLNVPLVDEHYYQPPGWFINNQHFYDNYDRNKPKVYLGEYASHGNTFYNALAEALYLTNIERNGDVVQMTSYAPLLAKEKHTQWNPDLIYFNNNEVKPTVNYEIQKLFGSNAGNEYLNASVKLSTPDEAVNKRFGLSMVRDTATGDLIIKMVNLLPVAISTNFDLAALTKNKSADKWQLHGSPEGKSVAVIKNSVQMSEKINELLPAYSFTVWRIHK